MHTGEESIGGHAFGIVISPSSLSRRRRNRHSPPPLKGPVIAITDGAFFMPSDMRKTNAPRAGRGGATTPVRQETAMTARMELPRRSDGPHIRETRRELGPPGQREEREISYANVVMTSDRRY